MKMTCKRSIRLILLLFAVFMAACMLHPAATVHAKKYKTYTISPNSKPADKSLLKNPAYNKVTKHYFLIQSYMDKFEKKGGGTLILKKGTYYINTTIAVPSNVTIKLKDGVVLKKTYKKHKIMGRSPMMFRFCAQKMYYKTRYDKIKPNNRGYKKHNGVKNVSIIGQGSATIDMGGGKNMYAFFMGHNKNCRISGITFKNLKDGHFIELDAGKNITIENCKFSGLSGKKSKEAINLDTPDVETGGFNQAWSSLDKTPNDGVTIRNCTFSSVNRAIGTHQYSYGYPPKNINIANCDFTGNYDANYIIRALNWDGAVISGCTFRNSYCAINCPGSRNITIKNNSFTHNKYRVIWFYPFKGSKQKKILVPYERESMIYGNKYSDMGEDFIRYCTGVNEANQTTIHSIYEKWDLK